MKLLLLFLFVLFGTSKAVVEDDMSDCIMMKVQQCIAGILKSAPLLFVSGEKTVDLKTRTEFGDCVLDLFSCSKKWNLSNDTKRSSKQLEFCGDDEDCYDNEEDDDMYSIQKPGDFTRCFKKNMRHFVDDLVDACLKVLGSVKSLISQNSNGSATGLNNYFMDLLCHVYRVSVTSLVDMTIRRCKMSAELFLPLVDLELQKSQKMMYDFCSIGSVLNKVSM